MSPLFELAAACGLLLVSVLLATRKSSLVMRTAVLALGAAVCVPIAESWARRLEAEHADATIAGYRPADLTADGASPYAGSGACKSCHPDEYRSWRNSFHRKMTQAVTPETVLADFDDVTIEHEGRTYRAFREGDRFYVDIPKIGTNGEQPAERMVRPVVMSTGSHHQQLYWYPLPDADIDTDLAARELYARRCAGCHGEDALGGEASGDKPAPPGLAQREMVAAWTERAIRGDEHQKKLDAPLTEPEIVAMIELVTRMQTPDRLMQFPFSWLVEDNRWVHEDLTFLGPMYGEYVTEPYDQGWSNACDACHAVGARFESPDLGDKGRAAVVELGISCEVCHGPAARHVLHHQSPLQRYASLTVPPDDIINPARLDPAREAAVCGQCHSENVARSPEERPVNGFRPGNRLEDHVHVVQNTPPLPGWLHEALESERGLLDDGFWDDGTIRIAGRDYNGLVRTGCHTDGTMSCGTCHTMHGDDPDDQLRPEAKTGAVCTTCHADIAAAGSAHTHHPEGSSGSDCYACHMPRTTWGLLIAMRAHRVTSPQIATSLLRGRPNACNLCHIDKPLAFTTHALAEWYGQKAPTGPEPWESTSPADVSAALVWLLRGDGVQRAIAAWHMGSEPALAAGKGWAPGALARALDDPYPAVRYVAHKSLIRYEGFEGFAYDYAAGRKDLAEARRRALDLWSPTSVLGRSEVLMTPHGPDLGRLRALEILRDRRPVSVNE